MPEPTGTGFFVSPDGWFITASHVISVYGKPAEPRPDLASLHLSQPMVFGSPPTGCGDFSVVVRDPSTDFALLKADLASVRKHD